MNSSRSVTINGSGGGESSGTGGTVTAVEVTSETQIYSTASYTLTMNGDPDVHPAPLEGLVEDFNTFVARILGRAHDLDGDFDDTAQQFSDVLKWSIEGFSKDDLALWSDVSSNMSFCAAIVENWKDTVQTYKDERLRIINRWNEEAPVLAADLDKAPPNFQLMWNDSPAEAAEKALQTLKEELEGEESTAYRVLRETGDQLSDDLKSGPTTDAVGRLMEGGYVTWSQFNLGGSASDMPDDVDPAEMADGIVPYVQGDKELDDDYYEMLAVLSAIGWRAERANSGEGDDMDPADMEFLKDFYDQLDSTMPPLTDLARLAPELMGEEDAVPLLAALGTGVLVLSDSRLKHGDDSIPGGYYDLPPSVRAAVEGDPDFGMRDIDWEALGNLFGHVPEGVEGGRGLSLTMGLTVGNELNDPYLYPTGELSEHMQAVLDVATRNADANADMISGPGDWYEHPRLGSDMHGEEKRHEALEAIFTHEWPDDGAAASGYTDWILEAREEAGDDTRAVDEVAKDLIDFLTEEERYERMTGLTGGMYSDDLFGQDGLSFTQVNNEMANGLLGVFGAYVGDFSLNPEDGGGVSISESNGALLMGVEERERFLEFVAGSEDSAISMVAITEMYTDGLVGDMFLEGDDKLTPLNAGEHANRLNEIVNQALINEAHSRTESADSEALDEHERRKAGRELMVEMLFKPGELISTNNAVGQLVIDDMLSTAKDAATAAATESLSLDLGPVANMNAEVDDLIAANHIRAGSGIIDHYIDEGLISEEMLSEFEYLNFRDGRVVISEHENQFRSDVQDDINNLISGVDGGRGSELLVEYLDSYHKTKTDGTGGESPEEDVDRPTDEDE